MKKLLSVILLAAMVLTMSGCSNGETTDVLTKIKEEGKIVLATSPDFPPNEFYILDDDGNKQIVGSDISLAQAVADKIGVKLEIKATDFDGVLANLQSGSVDFGIAGFAKTEARAKVMQFSDGYQREASDGFQGIMTTKENAEKYKTLEDFKNAKLKLAAQTGSIQYEMAQKLTDATKIKQFGTTDAAALALDSGDVDAMVVSTSNCEPLLKTFTNLVILPQDEFDLDAEGMYSTSVIGFPLGDEYQSLIEVCNEVIAEARANGKIESWVDDAKALSKEAIE